jgi:hypothetical protein
MTNELPGFELYPYVPYGYKEHLKKYGDGTNALRTTQYAQPHALKVGDVLVTGETILSKPREAGNGDVFIHLSHQRGGGCWIEVPSRIPIAIRRRNKNESKSL